MSFQPTARPATAHSEVAEPLYVRTAARIRERLVSLELKPGDLIEPERILGRELGVSRITLRKAIDLLVQEHLLLRRQGVGTFVASPKITHPLVGLHSTRDIAKAHGLSIEISIVEHEFVKATPDARIRLELSQGARVLRFVRSDTLIGQPISVAESTVPEALSDGLTAEALACHSTYELIELNYSVRVASARQILYADAASPSVARLLSIRRGQPVLVLDRVSFDATGRPVEWGVVSYPHDRVECVVDLQRPPGGLLESATDLAVRFKDNEE